MTAEDGFTRRKWMIACLGIGWIAALGGCTSSPSPERKTSSPVVSPQGSMQDYKGAGWKVPPFQGTDSQGRTFRTSEQLGRVWVAGFMFLRCPDSCPIITQTMVRLKQELSTAGLEGVPVVAFTVDPAHDTTAVLRRYQEGEPAKRSLRMVSDYPFADLQAFAQEGFHADVQNNTPVGGQGGHADHKNHKNRRDHTESKESVDPLPSRVLHSNNLYVMDKEGNVRSYFDVADATQGRIGDVVKFILKLQNEAR